MLSSALVCGQDGGLKPLHWFDDITEQKCPLHFNRHTDLTHYVNVLNTKHISLLQNTGMMLQTEKNEINSDTYSIDRLGKHNMRGFTLHGEIQS